MIKKTSPDEIENFLSDAANVKGKCEAVYFPESEADVSEIMRNAYADGTRVTVSGNGTGLTGGRVPDGGIVISTEKLNKIKEINRTDKYAVAGAAVILKDFQDEVENISLFYPPDPTEKSCFIGAAAATNSSGAKTFKYGPTRDYILGLRIVLPDGDILNLTRGANKASGYALKLKTESGKELNLDIPDYKMPATKHAAGYYCHKDMDAIDLFIGSEGTLGIITELKLKLLDLPVNIFSAVIFFDEEDDALALINEARTLSFKARKENLTSDIDARGLEYFDYYSLRFLYEEYPQIPRQAKAAVWLEQETDKQTEEIVFEKWLELIARHNGGEETAWFASDKADMEKFKDFRHAISAKIIEYIAHNNITKVGTDIAVPDDVFVRFYKNITALPGKAGLNYLIYGHFGNSHVHLNMLPEKGEEFLLAKKLYMEICRIAVELNGTISAEHGVGKLKREYLLMMFGEDNIKKMAKLKSEIDPHHILCIGNMFDEKYLV
ncbi:MAG: FAD-binding oxidoreductase [Ignavibacteria bacterium]